MAKTKSKTVKSFREWYEDEDFPNRKPTATNKRKQMRKESALKKLDVEAYLDEDEWEY